MRNTIMTLSTAIAIAFVVGYVGIGCLGNAIESLSEPLKVNPTSLSGSSKGILLSHGW